MFFNNTDFHTTVANILTAFSVMLVFGPLVQLMMLSLGLATVYIVLPELFPYTILAFVAWTLQSAAASAKKMVTPLEEQPGTPISDTEEMMTKARAIFKLTFIAAWLLNISLLFATLFSGFLANTVNAPFVAFLAAFFFISFDVFLMKNRWYLSPSGLLLGVLLQVLHRLGLAKRLTIAAVRDALSFRSSNRTRPSA